jgi:hypothetical protein
MKECPITLCPFHDLSNPVAFSSALDQPYELDALCSWMEVCPRNPLTGRVARIDDLVALGSASQQRESVEWMKQRDLTITLNQVFRNEVNEIKVELEELNERIRDVANTMSVLMGEKTRIETRIDFINKQNYAKKCPYCTIS